MAIRYVRSGASGANDGSSKANAHTSIVAAITASTAGDRFFVASDHNENITAAGAQLIQSKGTHGFSSPGIMDEFLCVDFAVSTPPVAADLTTGAQIVCSGSAFMKLYGSMYCYGIKWGGLLELGTEGTMMVFEKCSFSIYSGGILRCNYERGSMRIINSTFSMNDGDQISLQGTDLIIDGPSNTPLFTFTGSYSGGYYIFGASSSSNIQKPLIRNADLSNIPSGTFLTIVNNNGGHCVTTFVNCKLPASGVPIQGATGGTSALSGIAKAIGCHSAGGTTARNEISTYMCNLTTETTIVRTGGASDGTTPFSWKLTPQNTGVPGNSFDNAFESFEGTVWNDAVGVSKTLTVHVVTDGITLQDNELWLEVDYLGTSGAPLATRISTQPATRLTAPANLAADSGTAWTTTGLSSPTKQKVSATFTPQIKGPIRWRLRYARTSGVAYVCPLADIA